MRRLFLVLALLLALSARAEDAGRRAEALRAVRETALGHYGMAPIYGRDVADGTYDVRVEADPPLDGIARAVLTVAGGEMSVEITPEGGAALRISVPALNRAFDCAALDGRLLIDAAELPAEALAFPLPDYELLEQALLAQETAEPEAVAPEPMALDLPDGEYAIEVNLAGGGGRAGVSSPTLLILRAGRAWARLIWSGADCDALRVGGQRYENLSDGGNATFEIPVPMMDAPFPVAAHTAATGAPAELACQLTFYSASIGDRSQVPQEAAKKVLVTSLAIIVVGGVLNYFVKRRRR